MGGSAATGTICLRMAGGDWVPIEYIAAYSFDAKTASWPNMHRVDAVEEDTCVLVVSV